jgi:phosphoribosylaminoimidazole (AIR) synthetase
MENSHSASYAAAGVDIEAGYKGVQLMKKHVARTMIPGVVSGIGGFGGLFAPDLAGMKEPVLVSGTDGVGTKIRLAQLMTPSASTAWLCASTTLSAAAHGLSSSWTTSPSAKTSPRRWPPLSPA